MFKYYEVLNVQVLDVVSLLAALKEIALHLHLYASSSKFEKEKRSPWDIF